MITNYDQLPIGSYLDILALDKKGLSEIEYQTAVVSILSGKTEDELLDMPIQEYLELVASADFLNCPLLGKDGRKPHDGRKVPDRFTVPPFRLVLTKDVRKMNVAQYVDFQNYSKDTRNIPEMLSCVLIPEGYKYNDGYDIVQVQQAIRASMPATMASEITAFFLRKYAASIRRTLISSAWILHKIPRRKRTPQQAATLERAKRSIRLLRGGAGLQTLMLSLSSPAVPGTRSGR